MEENTGKMKYTLEECPPAGISVAYALQHLIYFLAGAAIVPVVVGTCLGLSQPQLGDMLQRTFLISGLMSFVQAKWGHRYPIIDAPAGLWTGMMVILASSAPAFGKALPELRAELEFGMIAAGALIVLLGVSGWMKHVARLFTPLVNGVFLILMVLQISPTIVNGMMGLAGERSALSLQSVLVFGFTAVLVLVIHLKAKGFLQSVATLLGCSAGWILAFSLGAAPVVHRASGGFLSLPQPFAWGMPKADGSVILVCMLGYLALFANVIASFNGMAEVLGESVTPKQLNRGTACYGISAVLTGAFPTIGFVPFASSMGVIEMTRVAARRPFLLGSLLMLVLGLIAPIGAVFAAIPQPVGYAAMLVVFAMIVGQGLNEFRKVEFHSRENVIVGISLILGVGVMFADAAAFSQLPQILKYLLSNGLIDGMILVILMEHVFLRDGGKEKRDGSEGI